MDISILGEISDTRKELREIRKELDGKIDAAVKELNTNVRWVIGVMVVVLIAILGGLIGFMINHQSSTMGKLENHSNRISTVETRISIIEAKRLDKGGKNG